MTDQSFRKQLAILSVLLIVSSFLAISILNVPNKNNSNNSQLPTIYQDDASNQHLNDETVQQNTNQEGFIISSDIKKRILWYESFEKRDLAVTKIPRELISSIYTIIPAISTYPISSENIPLDGIKQVIDDRKAYHLSYFEQQRSIRSIERKGFSLLKTARMIEVDKLHELDLTGKGIKIAILDSGVESSLESFDDESGATRVQQFFAKGLKNKGSEDQDPHGTHVAGITAGNGRYYADGKWDLYDSPGIAPEASIISIRVLDEEGFGEISDIVDGMQIAVDEKVDIISMSLSSELYNGSSDLHIAIINQAIKAGIVVIAAAGNLGPIGSGVGIPGGLENVLTVGAADMNDQTVWSFSGVGPRVNGYPGPNVIAPGVEIVSIGKNGQPSLLTGTSMATPHVTGGIALLLEAFPKATVYQIQEAITGSATDMGLFEPVEAQGRGMVNLYNAYQILNRSTSTPTHLEMNSVPRIIKDQNYFYRNRISGFTKTLPVYIHSSRNLTIIPHIDDNKTRGAEFDLPQTVEITEGLTRFEINVTVTSQLIELNFGQIYFTSNDSNKLLPNANISYISITSYKQSKILFDTSHDLDTPSAYFGGHGPKGQFSKMVALLENERHMIYEHKTGEITSSELDNYDLLIIADPDKDYSNAEIAAIQKFTQDKGKSLLLIVGGGLLIAENYIYAPSNINSINKILSGSGLKVVDDENHAITDCESEGNEDRRLSCFETAKFTRNQNIYSDVDEFPNFGPALEIDEVTNQKTSVIAKLNGKAVITSSDLSSSGRILVFSSPLLFDNLGLIYNYGSDGSAPDNRIILEQSIDWLIEPRVVKADYLIDDIDVGKSHAVSMYKVVTIKLAPKTPTGIPIPLGDKINVSVVEVDFEGNFNFRIYEFTEYTPGIYQYVISFNGYYDLDFFIKLRDPNNSSIDSNGHLILYVRLDDFSNQPTFQTISTYLFFALFVSWILWVTNEGGRRKKLMDNEKFES